MGCAQSAPKSSPQSQPVGGSKITTKESEKTNEESIELAFKAKKQRDAVFSESPSAEALKGYVPIKVPKSAAHMKLIKACLLENYMFKTLADTDLKLLVDVMTLQECSRSETIFTQGQQGDNLYVAMSGSFSVLVNNKKVASLEAGDSSAKLFGELALLYNSPRAATVKADTAGVLYSLNSTAFKFIIAQSAASSRLEIKKFLSKIPLLDKLTDEQFDKLCDTVELVPYEENVTIFKRGDIGNIFYMIKEGVVHLSQLDSQYKDHNLKAGDYFGEIALMTGQPRAATATSKEKCSLLALDRLNFDSILGPLADVLEINQNMRIIGSIKIFDSLSREDRAKVLKSFSVENFAAGDSIIRQGETGKKFYIIKEGTVKVEANGTVLNKEMPKGNHFGEMALLSDQPRASTVIATSDVQCFVLDQAVFKKIAGDLNISKETDKRAEAVQSSKAATPSFLDLKIDQLKELALLGSGTFGRVTLVQDNAAKEKPVYALKTMLKSEIVAHKQQANVINERNIMAQLNHTFILRLYQTFKDPRKIHMLLDFVQGGELFSVLHTAKSDGVPDAQAKFYAAGIILALGYMHDKEIAYRDMKPENCLVDKMGYPKLIDFGFAKVINGKSFTLCGTPEYLAPELVLGRGHNKAVDYWAFGILVYEMQAGYSPFCDPMNGDQNVILKNIVNARCAYPPGYNKDCQQMCAGLLTREVQSRLGNRKDGVDEIMMSKWFSSLSFDDMMKRKIKAPWVPKLKGDQDFSNFVPYEDDHVEDKSYVDRSNWDAEF